MQSTNLNRIDEFIENESVKQKLIFNHVQRVACCGLAWTSSPRQSIRVLKGGKSAFADFPPFRTLIKSNRLDAYLI